MKLLNIDQNAKTVKGQKRGYLTGVLYLAPANLSGYEVCPGRSPGCTAACLYTSGHGSFPKVKSARVKKTKWFFEQRNAFMAQLAKEIEALAKRAKKNDMIPVVRLNGTSDIAWERVKINGLSIMEKFPDIQFYDYTKIKKRAAAWVRGEMPPNYHITFSLNEKNAAHAKEALEAGVNVAVVFKNQPNSYMGATVVDGDEDDLRFTLPQGFSSVNNKGVVIGLKPKGRARKDASGFVV